MLFYSSCPISLWVLNCLDPESKQMGESKATKSTNNHKCHCKLGTQRPSLTVLLLSHFSCVWFCATPKTAAHQAPLSLGFSRQEHWSGLPFLLQCMKVKNESQVTRSCLTLSDPIGCSLPGSFVHGIFQAGVLDWAAISFSNAGKWKVKVKSLSCVRLLATPWAAAYQAPPSMGFSRQEYWSGVPLPSPP